LALQPVTLASFVLTRTNQIIFPGAACSHRCTHLPPCVHDYSIFTFPPSSFRNCVLALQHTPYHVQEHRQIILLFNQKWRASPAAYSLSCSRTQTDYPLVLSEIACWPCSILLIMFRNTDRLSSFFYQKWRASPAAPRVSGRLPELQAQVVPPGGSCVAM
jgi:hypothetical protein